MTPTHSADLKTKNMEMIAKKLNEIMHFKRGFYLHKCRELQHFLSLSEVHGMEYFANDTCMYTNMCSECSDIRNWDYAFPTLISDFIKLMSFLLFAQRKWQGAGSLWSTSERNLMSDSIPAQITFPSLWLHTHIHFTCKHRSQPELDQSQI